MNLLGAVLCLARGKHSYPVRCEIGGMRCSECGKPGVDFGDFGLPAYVDPERKLFDRAERLRRAS